MDNYGNEFGYPDLIIMLTHSKRYGGSGFTANAGKNSKGEPLKAIAMGDLIAPNDFTYINTRLQKKTFVHEFIHYLDYKRGDTRQNTAKLLRTKGEKAYYNTPGEFNAYFQEGEQEVEDLFKAIAKVKLSAGHSDKLKEMLSDIEIFKNWVVLKSNMFSKDWYNSLELKWKKKFMKRLYTLYIALKKEYKI